MNGLYYLAYIVAIFVIIQWYTSNEAAKTDTGAKGLLAMKPSEPVKDGDEGGGPQHARYSPSDD